MNYLKQTAIFLAILLITGSSYAQIRALKIGDKLPELIIKNIINYPATAIKSGDLKGKVLILDFWNTSCSSCIKAMPKLAALQRKFGDQLLILPVTSGSAQVISAYWKKNRILKDVVLPTVVADTILKQYFPAVFLPHEAWIDQNGVFVGTSNTQYVNESNIAALIGHKLLVLNKQVVYANYDFSKPLYNNFTDVVSRQSLSYTAISRHMANIKTSAKIVMAKDSNASSRVTFINYPILKLYLPAVKQDNNFYPDNRIIFEISDPAKYVYDEKKQYKDLWDKENTYCYEAVAPGGTDSKLIFEQMISNLNRHFGLNAHFEKRKVDCYVVRSTNRSKPDPKSTPAKQSYHGTINQYIRKLNAIKGIKPILIDSIYTDVHSFPSVSTQQIPQLEKTLLSAGFELIAIKRELSFFIISDQLPK